MKTTDADGLIHDEARHQSGAIMGAENAKRLAAYVEQLSAASRGLPSLNGKINTSAVALACGFNRAVLYQNPAARQSLKDAAARLGLDAEVVVRKASPVDIRDRRIQKLEQENANLKAEVFSLRRALRRMEHIEEVMVETGKRVTS